MAGWLRRRLGADRLQHSAGVAVVAGACVRVVEEHPAIGGHGEHPALLPGVSGHAPLPVRIRQRPARSLGSFVAGYKAAATRRINVIRGTPGHPVWQRNYYERVIRGDAELNRIRQYIADNPTSWEEDVENPDRAGVVGEPPPYGTAS